MTSERPVPASSAPAPSAPPGGPRALAFQAARNEQRAGASGIASLAIQELVQRGRSGASRAELEQLVLSLPAVQPAMAVLVHLADQCLKAIAASSAYPGAVLARAAHEFGDRELAATGAIAELAARWIDGAHRIVTLSASGTVRAALVAAARRAAEGGGHAPPVLVAESRPLLEGRELAAGLALAGLLPTVVVDAAIRSLLRPGDLVLAGADRIGWDGWVNKIGTRGLVEGAAVLGVPVLVLAPTTRFLPEGVEGEPEGQRSGREVWESAPAGVSLANPTFESLTFAGVERVVCEAGALAPADVVGRAVAIELDPRIAALRLRTGPKRAAR